ncbi:DNA internalization-related competence protein ComEC/Rec2 [Oceanobacillus sp. FSL K6-2867]|uniref:DNA internalization-related competence protein ComEC/Rec2 n=1 Tax=Oceanobacillus sp. FSL K6-2867 TaxID=2954748 RepID=UPI0030DA0772
MKGYWHVAAFAVGAATLRIYFENDWIIVAFLLWIFYLYFYERLKKLPIFTSLILFFFFSVYIPSPTAIQSPKTFSDKTAHYAGEIISPVQLTNDKLEFVIEEQHSKHRILILYFPEASNQETMSEPNPGSLKYGASCIIKGSMELPNESRNPAQFDYRDYLLKNGITYQLILQDLADLECEGSKFLERFYMLREQLVTHVESRFSPYTASWLTAIVFGDDSTMDSETEDLFQRWSLSHIIAISGSNIALIVALFYFLLIKLNLLTHEKAQWLMIFFLPVYALLAGGEPSVWRAAIMVVLFILLNKFKLRFSYTDILCIVFILLILFDKNIIYHVGFQLSFIVTFAILLSRNWLGKTESAIWQVLQISFVSQMVIIPIQFAYFSIFQPLSIILNLIVIPYFTIVVIPLMYILVPLSFLPDLFINMLDALFVNIHQLIIALITLIDAVLYFPFLTSGFPFIAILIYFGLFIWFMRELEYGMLRRAFRSGLLLSLLIMSIVARPYFSSEGTVTMFDIGQGDAFLIELPYRKGVMMIDAGSRFSFEDMEPTDSVYQQILRPYFNSRGIKELDAIILTHEDMDHIGSVEFLLKEMKIEQLIVSSYYDLSAMQAWSEIQKQPELVQVKGGELLTISGQPFYVLAPVDDRASSNENSIVIFTEFGGVNWLFTGDITKEEERELIQNYPNLPVDVLKVAHHGSSTSTDENFIQATDPSFALISVGLNNSYGHPTSEVLETLENVHAVTLRTDQHGAVQFKYRSDGGTFFPFLHKLRGEE